MTETKKILLVPSDWNRPINGDFDEQRVSDEVEKPKVTREKVPEDGETSVDRAFVSDPSKQAFADAHRTYKQAKDSGDTAAQVDALETMVGELLHIVTGDTASEIEAAFPAQDESSTSSN